jgi:MYXO-CTERM domain-containing protein
MNASPYRLDARSFVRALALVAAVLVAVWSSSARADVPRIPDDGTGDDPAATFDADCLGEMQAEDCQARAALIEGEIVTLLSQLDGDVDPATQELFERALELDSPFVRAMAVRYLSRAEAQPTDFLSSVKTFFLGPDAPLGVASSAALESLGEPSDQDLAELYREQRSESDYSPQEVSADPEEERLLQACIKDSRLDMMLSFSEEEQFSPAERSLMYDRFVTALLDPTEDYPVTAFVTDASVDEVIDFFTELFGDPYPPSADSEARLAELSLQLVELQGAAASGDQEAIEQLIALSEELTQVQQVASLQAYLQLPALHAENDWVFLDGSLEDFTMSPARAVTVGEDALLGKTVIRYINAPPVGTGGGVGSGQAGAPGQGSGGAASPGDGESDGEGGASDGDRPAKSPDDGCGCSVPGAPREAAGLGALAVLGLMLLRRRRQLFLARNPNAER